MQTAPDQESGTHVISSLAHADPKPSPPILAIKFSIDDLRVVAQFLNLKTIKSDKQHDGCNDLYLFEQLAFLDSLTSVEPPALKRRRIRHQHFWRDSEKLPFRERVFVRSADVQLALDADVPITAQSHLVQAEHTSVWTVCLTAFGAKELLNRKIGPLGVRLYRAMEGQLQLQQQAIQLHESQVAGCILAAADGSKFDQQ